MASRKLAVVENNGTVAHAFWDKMPDSWCARDQVGQYQFFATPGFLTTYMESDMYVVMHDKKRNTIFVWYTFIF